MDPRSGATPTDAPMIGVECSEAGAYAVLLAPSERSGPDAGTGMLASAQVPGPPSGQWLTELLTALHTAEPRAAQARGISVVTAQGEEALRDRRGLARVGCVRLAASAEDVVPPLLGWPPELRDALLGVAMVLPGGCDYDGRAFTGPTPADLDRLVGELRDNGIDAISVVATFSPVDSAAEARLAIELTRRLPGIPVSLSHSLGSIGLLERENASALNAALLPVAERLTAELGRQASAALPGVGVFLTRLDGTVMELPFAQRLPVHLLGSVAAARAQGVATLAGHRDALLLDQHAGQRRLAVIRDGEPGLSPRGLVVAGVPTSLPALDLVPVGPGPADWTQAAQAVGAADLPWVASASGIGGDRVPAKAPEHAAYAGAVGAASTRVAGLVDRIVPGDARRAPGLAERARSDAKHLAVLAGAREDTIAITELDESPLAYVPGDLVRLRVRATGRLP